MRFSLRSLSNSRRRITRSFVSLALDSHLGLGVSNQCNRSLALTSGLRRLKVCASSTISQTRCLARRFPVLFSSLRTSEERHSDALCELNEDDDNGDEVEVSADDDDYPSLVPESMDEDLSSNVRTIVDILRTPWANGLLLRNKVDQCGVTAKPNLVSQVLSQVRNNWEAAFTFFSWAGRQPGYAHSVREYHSMISILGKMRKFDTAWSLIEEMRGGRDGPSLVVPRTLLIMIRKYCAVHDVGRAVNTFYAYKRFNFKIGIDEFHDLLSALCRYKNVKEAEHLLFCNRSTFPLNVKSFNIILNGWCNIVCDLREAKRIWKEMKDRRIARDAFSYSSMLSCYSKFNHLNVVLKLFDHMKALNISPDRKIYNAVIHALGKGGLVKEAGNIMKAMEDDGIVPNTVTYNSLITPLCRARRSNEALGVFDQMVKRGISPTVRTYHALLRVARTGDEVFSLLQKMNTTACRPSHDTYIMLIRKFCRWRQLDNVFKLWNKMIEDGFDPDQSSYIVLIHGLFLNGRLEEAHRYSQEMKEKHLIPEQKMEKILDSWLSGKQNLEQLDNKTETSNHSAADRAKSSSSRSDLDSHFLRRPEARKFVRERGFSFWEK